MTDKIMLGFSYLFFLGGCGTIIASPWIPNNQVFGAAVLIAASGLLMIAVEKFTRKKKNEKKSHKEP